MSDPINITKIVWFFVTISLCSSVIFAVAVVDDDDQLFLEQETVENLVRRWAPLVWLSPGEKFMPGDVTEFLQHVHAEKNKPSSTPLNEVNYEYLDDEIVRYYESENELNKIARRDSKEPNQWETRNKRMFKDRNFLLDYIIDLPIGRRSANWFLVTNDDVDDLLTDNSSFIYGQNPNLAQVPIYAMISLCDRAATPAPTISNLNEINYNKNDRWDASSRIPYIPINMPEPFPYAFDQSKNVTAEHNDQNDLNNSILNRERRELDNRGLDDVQIDFTKPTTFQRPVVTKVSEEQVVPSFHVTYWMFYPYSQGKTMCTINLGPLGRLPIPLIFGMCLGTKKDFGSHIGDWEHMSLYFKGRSEPEEMYISTHDAGAFYRYEHLTGTFDFRSQETRKGILQRPNFPKTVRTSQDHPVLFSAQGSHGLWTAPLYLPVDLKELKGSHDKFEPIRIVNGVLNGVQYGVWATGGKHRFVRVPRLFDVNGFGTPWSTWKHIDISYIHERSGRTIGPEWLQFYGRWGNPKSKCHPLKRIGLNFCEHSDGPTGIPLKKPNFYCYM